MAGAVRLFEKDEMGLLHEVPKDQADARRAAGTISRVSLEIEVLWTDQELAERAQQEAASEAKRQQRDAAVALKEQQRQQAETKLTALGLTPGEIAALLG